MSIVIVRLPAADSYFPFYDDPLLATEYDAYLHNDLTYAIVSL
jgi:hypothetical protein